MFNIFVFLCAIMNLNPQPSVDGLFMSFIYYVSRLLVLINILRFSVQERLTKQIAIAVTKAVQPMGVAVVVEGV